MNNDVLYITDFCHNLKNLFAALEDINSPISETEFIMKIHRQLSPSYHNIVDIVTNTKPFSTFYEAKNMFLVHVLREINTKTNPYSFLNSTTLLSNTLRYDNKKKNRQNSKKNNTGKGASKEGNNFEFGAGDVSFAGNQHGGQVMHHGYQNLKQVQAYYVVPQVPLPPALTAGNKATSATTGLA